MEIALLPMILVAFLVYRFLRRTGKDIDLSLRELKADNDRLIANLEAARAELADIQSQAAGLRNIMRREVNK